MVSAMFIPLLVVSWYLGEGGISLMHVICLELQKIKMIIHFFLPVLPYRDNGRTGRKGPVHNA